MMGVNYYDNFSKKMKVIGIIGINGKIIIVFMIKDILEFYNKKVGLIGIIVNYIGNEKIYIERIIFELLEL